MKTGECAERGRKWGWGGVDRERRRERCTTEGKGGKAGLVPEAVMGGLRLAEQAGPPFSQYRGATGALCWNHSVSPEGAGPHSRVSSTCLDPADIGHKVTKGRKGCGQAGGLGAGRGARLQGVPSPLSSAGLRRASSAPGTRPLQAQRGSVCGPKGGHIDWAASGPLLRGAGTAMGHSSLRWGTQASAERQCHLVAGGIHTRLLPPVASTAPRSLEALYARVLCTESNGRGPLPPGQQQACGRLYQQSR